MIRAAGMLARDFETFVVKFPIAPLIALDSKNVANFGLFA